VNEYNVEAGYEKQTISQTESFVDFIIGADDYIADIVFENNSITLSFPMQ